MIRPIAFAFKTLFPAVCAILFFGFITWQLRVFERYIGINLPHWVSFVGIILIAAGAVLTFVCFALFAAAGSLTPGLGFPDPALFIETGPYRYVRNPMAEGLLVALLGWGFFLRSAPVVLFALLMAGLMHLFVVLVEEPKLERRFGHSYLEYKNRVGRWIPL